MKIQNTIRIANWNANGLARHVSELEFFLNQEKIDICLVSETHFVRSSHIKINGYECYRSDHPLERPRGGSAVIIKSSIKHYVHHNIQEESMQVSSITLLVNSKNCNIAAIYCPPRYNLKEADYVSLFKSLGPNFVIGGDFNAKNTYWGSRLTTTKGRELFSAGKKLHCDFYSSGNPTYWPTDRTKTPDLIDFFVAKGISNKFIHVEDSGSLMSDHSAIVLTISDTIIIKDNPPRLVTHYTNWDVFRKNISDNINLTVPLKCTEQLEDEAENFIKCIQRAAWASTPQETKHSDNHISYPQEVRQLIRDKRKARRTWHHTRAPCDKAKLNRLKNLLDNLSSDMKQETHLRLIHSLNTEKDTDYSLWKVTKSLKQTKEHVPPIKKENGEWAKSPIEKAEVFADHLEKTFVPNPSHVDDEELILTSSSDIDNIQPVTFSELKDGIRELNTNKAPGYDLITGNVIKQLPEEGVRMLLYIINAALRLKYVPRCWKVAEVIMILKPGKDPKDKKSYRPISLLPVISKLFERLLVQRLKITVEERGLIPNHQFGFREKHSTIDQVHRITDIIENCLEKQQVCAATFLDVSQAFDKVWHKGLEYKLERDLPKQFYTILKSYLAERHFRVKHEGEYSNLKQIRAGVPQGSVLGPLLYLLYTRDVPSNHITTIATFADDTALLAVGDTVEEATSKLQNTVDDVSTWTKKWRLKLNEQKSAHINFTNKKVTMIPVMLNGQVIPYANTAKYLGMTLDAKLRWKEHVIKKRDQLNIKFKKMYWLLGRYSELSLHNKLLIYKQILRPVWTYGIQLWGCTKKTNSKIIQTFQNKVLRSIVNAPWYIRNDDLHRDLKIETVSEVVKNFATKHEQRLHKHMNPEALRLLDNSNVIRRLDRTKPLDLVTQ